MKNLKEKLLWIDGIGAVLGGALVLALLNWLTGIYLLPKSLLIAVGVTNLAYGAYSLSLARRNSRPAALIALLCAGNVAWGLACWVLAATRYQEASYLGVGHLVLEGLYVGGLGCLEWHWRHDLRTA